MGKKPSFEEFETFRSEEERKLLKWIIIGDFSFLVGSFLLMYVAEEVFKLKALSWPHYWILVGGNLLIFSFSFFALIKNFKIWLVKYLIAIFIPLLVSSWIYFSNPNYVKMIFGIMPAAIIVFAMMFYDFKSLILSALATAICFGLLFFHFAKINVPFPFYEIYIFYLFLVMFVIISYVLIQRTRLFLAELLEKRRELEEAKTVLEIKVAARTKELRDLAESLEEKVKERTKELQEKTIELQKRVAELEEFHRLTVGRELKMIELKEEIERLKKELERYKGRGT
jgi:hypothetical protein